jgi:hypothetical protein
MTASDAEARWASRGFAIAERTSRSFVDACQIVVKEEIGE